MTRPNWTRATAALAGPLLLLAACGDTGPVDDEAADETPAEASAPAVSFASPDDGATVTNPVALRFEASDFTVEPAGEVHAGAGHLHVMVDVPCVAVGEVIPKDDQHVHYGDGQTEVELDLPAGEHTLCLQAGDGAHTALDVTDEITITVTEAAPMDG